MWQILLFLGIAGGVGSAIAGLLAVTAGNQAGWLYLLLAVLLFILAVGPGRILRNRASLKKPDE